MNYRFGSEFSRRRRSVELIVWLDDDFDDPRIILLRFFLSFLFFFLFYTF